MMFRVDLKKQQLIELSPTNYTDQGLMERFHIQEWVEKSPTIFGEELLIIGKEVMLPSGKRLDLLCIDKSAALVVVELKRDHSGSAVEWQAIKYTSYCSSFLQDEIYERYAEYRGDTKQDAAKAIEEFIEEDISRLNERQRIILASKEFHSEVVSAILWLREFGVDIQCTRLAPYVDEGGELFINPETIVPLPEAKDYIERKEIKQRNSSAKNSDWTGYWFVNVGEGPHRTWEDNVRYSFISAGQGKRFSLAMKRLTAGDKIYAYIAGRGYVGFGEVVSQAMMIKDFYPPGTEIPLLKNELAAERPEENSHIEELSEWVVEVSWIKVFPKEEAKTFNGVFANQNAVCRLRNAQTLEFLHKVFGQ